MRKLPRAHTFHPPHTDFTHSTHHYSYRMVAFKNATSIRSTRDPHADERTAHAPLSLTLTKIKIHARRWAARTQARVVKKTADAVGASPRRASVARILCGRGEHRLADREELEQLMRKGRASSVQLLLDLGDEIVHRDEPLLFLLNRGHPTFCYHVEDAAAPFPLVVAEETTLR